MALKYKLATGAQVREEDFGLLLYTQKGPRLYFLPSGKLLNCAFFKGDVTLAQWLENDNLNTDASERRVRSFNFSLGTLWAL